MTEKTADDFKTRRAEQDDIAKTKRKNKKSYNPGKIKKSASTLGIDQKQCRKAARKDLKAELAHFARKKVTYLDVDRGAFGGGPLATTSSSQNYTTTASTINLDSYCVEKLLNFYCTELYEEAASYPKCAHLRDNTLNLDFFECFPEISVPAHCKSPAALGGNSKTDELVSSATAGQGEGPPRESSGRRLTSTNDDVRIVS
ncbi:unnamed protein product, partial [Amoebophrya sp. A120]|eukprot:GSA120T00015571001.1